MRQPSSRSAARRRPGAGAAGSSSSSVRPIARSASAEPAKLTALATTVVTAPSAPIAAPPSGGPSAVAVQVVDSKRALATNKPSRSTKPFRNAPLAARNAMSAAPTTTETTTNWANVSHPSA